MAHRVTLADIAKETGVSKATVSLALNGNPRISEKTRLKIERMAESLGYTPDPALSSLASYRWDGRRKKLGNNLALLTDQPELSRHVIPSVQAEAKLLGFNLEILNCPDYETGGVLSDILVQRGVQGIILSVKNNDWLADFDWSSFSVVNAGHNDLTVPLHQVRADAVQSVYGAWRKVHELGYQRIGIAVFHEIELQAIGMLRLAAADCVVHRLSDSEKEAVFVFESQFVGLDSPDFNSEILPFKEWIQEVQPDVIIGTNAVVYWYLRELGYHVPKDLSLALIRIATPEQGDGLLGFAGMTCDENLMGRRMIDELSLQIKRGETGIPDHPYVIVLPPYWVDGESCPLKK